MPNVPNNSAITPEDIRHFIYDRAPKDNPIDLDLAWSDPEIVDAMRYCAMSYNSIPPYVERVSPDAFPREQEMIWIHGTIYHLYLSRKAQLIRQDLDYTAGNMTVDRTKRLIEHLDKGIEFYKGQFDELAKQRKLVINLNNAYGCVG